MTIERPALNVHLALCIVALIIGVLVFANVLHVNLHQGIGLTISVIAILLAL